MPISPEVELAQGYLLPQSAETLLNTPLRQQLINLIWQRTSLSKAQFESLYLTPLRHYAELVQQLPASENHHHAYLGGMLDHTLEVMAFAARMRQSHLLPPGEAPEEQAKEAEAWTTAIIYGAMLHDIGKPLVDLQVITQSGKIWHPWHGLLHKPYRLRYQPREYRLHACAGALLVTAILPSAALDWLSGYPGLFASLLYCLTGHYDQAGIVGEIVQQADQASVAQNMGGDSNKVLGRPQTSLPKQILAALRQLVQHELTLSNPQSGSDGWLTDDALWLISKITADRIRAWLLQHGITGIPDSNTRLFDEMQAHRLIIANGDKAIWHCHIRADSGWSPGAALTLLRLSPSLIWQEIAQRPAVFAGEVTVSTTSEADAVQPITEIAPVTDKIKNNPPALDDLTCSRLTADALDIVTGSVADSSDIEQSVTATGLPSSATLERPIQRGPTSSFLNWLKNGLNSYHLLINDTQAKIHLVEGKVFLISPEIFKLYIKETTGSTGDEWKQVQKDFQKLKLHLRGEEGINIWSCEVKGARKARRVKGYLLEDPSLLFHQVPEDNPYLSIIA